MVCRSRFTALRAHQHQSAQKVARRIGSGSSSPRSCCFADLRPAERKVIDEPVRPPREDADAAGRGKDICAGWRYAKQRVRVQSERQGRAGAASHYELQGAGGCHAGRGQDGERIADGMEEPNLGLAGIGERTAIVGILLLCSLSGGGCGGRAPKFRPWRPTCRRPTSARSRTTCPGPSTCSITST